MSKSRKAKLDTFQKEGGYRSTEEMDNALKNKEMRTKVLMLKFGYSSVENERDEIERYEKTMEPLSDEEIENFRKGIC